jgi:hypothetical protein
VRTSSGSSSSTSVLHASRQQQRTTYKSGLLDQLQQMAHHFYLRIPKCIPGRWKSSIQHYHDPLYCSPVFPLIPNSPYSTLILPSFLFHSPLIPSHSLLCSPYFPLTSPEFPPSLFPMQHYHNPISTIFCLLPACYLLSAVRCLLSDVLSYAI